MAKKSSNRKKSKSSKSSKKITKKFEKRKWDEWNDKAAAAEHRKDQARKLIRRVRVIWEGERVRVYNVPSVRREQGTYRPAKVIITTQTDYQRALGQALAKLRAAQEAVSELRAAAWFNTLP